jgi:hypothetical protein
MSVTILQTRRAIRAYDDVHRAAIHHTEREVATREPQPPEPCNFCAHDDAPPPADRFAELAQVLGRWWLAWLVAYVLVCAVAVGAAGALIYLSVAP